MQRDIDAESCGTLLQHGFVSDDDQRVCVPR
jgi:hypothetical protein